MNPECVAARANIVEARLKDHIGERTNLQGLHSFLVDRSAEIYSFVNEFAEAIERLNTLFSMPNVRRRLNEKLINMGLGSTWTLKIPNISWLW